MAPATYHSIHNRDVPPADQVINTEHKNILLREIYRRAEEKLTPKRAASDNLIPEHGSKQPRVSTWKFFFDQQMMNMVCEQLFQKSDMPLCNKEDFGMFGIVNYLFKYRVG